MSQIVIVSGPPGAGKSTVCDALCERYDRTVHLETDDIYAWIRMGYVPPWREGSRSQNVVVSRAGARAAAAFARQHYGVFVDGVIGPAHLPVYIEELQSAGVPVHFVVLLPPLEELLRRAGAREKRIAASEDVLRRVRGMFEPQFAGITIDTAGMGAPETADRIMDACGRGECLVWTPP